MFTNGMVRRFACGLLWLTSLTFAHADDAKTWARLEAAHARSDAESALILRSRIRDPILAPLADYWVLSARLNQASHADVDAFLARWQGTYYEDRLRAEWMRLLGKQQAWDQLLEHHARYRMRDDSGLACWMMAARVERGQAFDRVQLERLWLSGQSVLPGCAHAVAVLWSRQQWTEALIWQKVRAAIEYREWKHAKAAVEIIDPSLRRAVDEVHLRHERILSGYVDPSWRPFKSEVMAWALIRAVRLNPETHAVWAARIGAAALSAEQRQWLQATLGTWMALQHVPGALERYPSALHAEMSDTHREWRLRSAIVAQNWALVMEWIGGLPDQDQQRPQWKYWLAQAWRSSSQPDLQVKAEAVAQDLADEGGYYGMLAASSWRLMPRMPESFQVDPVARRRVQQTPGLRRAVGAYKLGLQSAAAREWNYTIALHDGQLWPDADLRAAAQWACELQWWRRCINTSERMDSLDAVQRRFPTPELAQIRSIAERVGVNVAVIYALIRQESRFTLQSRSPVGAAGLMQLMPGTARWMGQQLGWSRQQMAKWREPGPNLELGMHYFKRLSERSNSSLSVIAASYNAGPNRVKKWLPEHGLPTALWIESISVNETREYVQALLWGAQQYHQVILRQTLSADDLLGSSVYSALVLDDDTP